ncbi:sensor domain-containing diguanylate cyclase [Arhodomonas aquaeolei]|uniref:sensor domain-containing diguanylate cyclase n=1 Tax=Arhodomonas aquaeolei TaxID=2369 RepID=UPI0003705184|nr:GGDEF domain-containing protein [Arhodomonas aquaeolei]
MPEYALLDNLVTALNIGVVIVDRERRVRLWNHFMEMHSGHTAAWIKGRDLCEVFPELPQDWFSAKLRSVAYTRQAAFSSWTERPWLFRFDNPHQVTGGPKSMYQDCTFLPLAGPEDEHVEHICVTVMDVTDTAVYQQQLQDAQARLLEMSIRDPLTGISNRRHLEECLATEYQRARRYDLPLSVIMFDIDHFKRINDTFGHQAGDDVIRRVAGIAEAQRRTPDTLGRYGGEEFTLVLPETGLEGAHAAAHRLCDTIAETAIPASSETIHTTVSVGVAALHTGDDSHDKLLDRADAALYEAKSMGRNSVVVARPTE